MRRILVVLLSLLIVVAPAVAPAAETGRIEGRVLDGDTDEPVAGVEVTLTSAAEGGTETFERTATTDAKGRYRFENLPTGEDRFYALDAIHDGGLFSGGAVTLPPNTEREPVIETTLRVWDTTTQPDVVLVRRDDIFISQSDEGGGIGVVESVRVVNTSSRAYIGRGGDDDGASPGRTATLGFALPQSADNESVSVVDAEIDIPALLRTEYGFALTTAIPPGETRITFSYPLEGTAGSYDLSRRALYPIADLAVYATDPFKITSDRLSRGDDVTVGGRDYQSYETTDALDAGDSLQAIAVADAGTPSGLLVGMAGVLALVIFLGVFPLIRSRRAEKKPTKTRTELVEAIARLDLEHEHGDLPTDRWASRRAELKSELAARGDAPEEAKTP